MPEDKERRKKRDHERYERTKEETYERRRLSFLAWQKKNPKKVRARQRRYRNKLGLRGKHQHAQLRRARTKLNTRRHPDEATTHINGCELSIVSLQDLRSPRFILKFPNRKPQRESLPYPMPCDSEP